MTASKQEFPALAELAAVLRDRSEAEPLGPSGPPPSLEQLRTRRDELIAISGRFGASELRIIGSVARGTATPASDVDFLVALAPERSLLDLGGLQVALQDLLGCRVHVVADDQSCSVPPVGEAASRGREERLLERLVADAVPV